MRTPRSVVQTHGNKLPKLLHTCFLECKNQDFACITWIKSTIQCPPPHPTSMLMASRESSYIFWKKRENKEGRAKPGDETKVKLPFLKQEWEWVGSGFPGILSVQSPWFGPVKMATIFQEVLGISATTLEDLGNCKTQNISPCCLSHMVKVSAWASRASGVQPVLTPQVDPCIPKVQAHPGQLTNFTVTYVAFS